MRFWPFKTKAAIGPPQYGGWRRVLEPFTGAWQKNASVDYQTLTAYPTLYAALDRISADIGKLPFVVMATGSNGIARTVKQPAIAKTLRQPNPYQTASQFRRAWLLSKLTYGNAAILKAGGELFVLDWSKVQPLVSDSGNVFYKITLVSEQNLLSERFTAGDVTVPASEIIHDRMNCLNHQLIGVPPLAAAYWPTVKNHHILVNNAKLFENGSQMGGILSAPAGISDDDAKALRDYWQSTKPTDVRVIGMDAKFSPFTQNSVDSQLVEQLEYSERQICEAFGIPPFIVGVESLPSGLQPEQMINTYYRFALQAHIQSMEELLTEGLNLPQGQHITLDTDELLRMDTARRAQVFGQMVKDGIATTNEARAQFNLPPLEGGGTVFRQQQDMPLSVAAQGGTQDGRA